MRYIVFLLLVISGSGLKAQVPDTIDVGLDYAVMMVFYAGVDDWLCGSEEVSVAKIDNKITLQAKVEDFYQTNLIVQIEDKYMAYILRYNNRPKSIVPILDDNKIQRKSNSSSIVIERNDVKNKEAANSMSVKSVSKKDKTDISTIEQTCESLFKKKRDFNSLGFVNYGVYFMVDNIFISEDKLFFTVSINNKSKIKYDISLIRWVVESKDKLMKKTVFQPIDKQEDLLYIYNEDEKEVLSKESVKKIYVFNKFTFDNDKKLTLELREKNGERIIDFSIEISDILNGKNI